MNKILPVSFSLMINMNGLSALNVIGLGLLADLSIMNTAVTAESKFITNVHQEFHLEFPQLSA